MLDALTHALSSGHTSFSVKSYHEHSLGEGSEARAAAYITIQTENQTVSGAGINTDIVRASINALISALNILI